MTNHAKVQEGHPILGCIVLSILTMRHRHQILRRLLQIVMHTICRNTRNGKVLLMHPDKQEHLCLLEAPSLKHDSLVSLCLLPRGMA
jgi:hypothetical protein